jgi:hypothetical protein
VASTHPTTLPKAQTAASPMVVNNESSALVASPDATPPARPPLLSSGASAPGDADGEGCGLGVGVGSGVTLAVAAERHCRPDSVARAVAGIASTAQMSTHDNTAWAKAVPSARGAGNGRGRRFSC